MKKTIIPKWLIILYISIGVMLVVAFVFSVTLLYKRTKKISENGTEFTAVCTNRYYQHDGQGRHDHYKYEFEIIEPEEEKGRVFYRTSEVYMVGEEIHGKYLIEDKGPIKGKSFSYILN